MFFPRLFSLKDTIGLCASSLFKFQIKAYIGHTVHAQVDELKEASIPLDLPNGIDGLVFELCKQQRQYPRYDYASNEQLEIDRLVYQAYGLNEADIREVENWYARRYPKLAQAQLKRLAAKRGVDEEQLQVRTTLHLYCDESRHLTHDHEPCMLMGLLSCPKDKVRNYHLELRDLVRTHGLTDNYEIKWTHIRPGKLDFYQEVVDWFFSKPDLIFRCLLLPSKKTVFERLPEDSQDLVYYRLYAHLLRSAFEPENRYRAFIDKKDTRGGDKIRQVKEWLRRDQDDADGKGCSGHPTDPEP